MKELLLQIVAGVVFLMAVFVVFFYLLGAAQ